MDNKTYMDKVEQFKQPNKESINLDRFEIPRNNSKYFIEVSVNQENPDLVIKSQQIHGKSYVDHGYINESALTADGRFLPELDGARDREDGTVDVSYLLAREPGLPIEDAIATMRLVRIGDEGTIEDLPTCKYFKNEFSPEVKDKLESLVDAHGPKSVMEIAALSVIRHSDSAASYEIMRAVIQNSIIKAASYNDNEVYIASLTKQSLRPVVKFAGSKAVEALGDPIRIYADDPRLKEVYVTPVLIYPNKILDGILDEIESSDRDMEITNLVNKLSYLTDGLDNNQVSDRVSSFFNKINN